MSGRDDFRRQKELEEGRKAGLIPAEKDEEGNDINPHIPQYIARAPWYVDDGAPSLKHQRVRKAAELDSDAHRTRRTLGVAQRFRSGACTNCGSMTHGAKLCLERPRKLGARFTGKDIQPDECVQEAALGYDGKHDRWAGYDPAEYASVVEQYESVEAERLRLKSAARELEGGAPSDSSAGSGSGSGESEEEERYAEGADMVGQQLDPKGRMTVRNLRMREDTAKYLRNLDPESAHYDPKTRSMRDNPNPAGDMSLLPFAGDNFVRQSGDALKLPQLQLFAWQAAERGLDVSLQANPSQLEALHRQHERAKDEEARRREQELLDAYGEQPSAPL